MFRSNKNKPSRSNSSVAASSALFNILNEPSRSAPSRSRSAGPGSDSSALERILKGESSNYDPNYTPVIRSKEEAQLKAMTDALYHAEILEDMVNAGAYGTASGKQRRKHRGTPRRTKSDDGTSSVSSRSSRMSNSSGRSSRSSSKSSSS